jgi:hypothetical protein
MALSRDFRQTVQARAARDPAFREALFEEAVQTLLGGDIGAGRAAMRNYIHATVGFERLSAALGRPQKGPDANVQSIRQSHRREPSRRDRRVTG